MAIYQRRISCQGFSEKSWVPLTIEDRIFWISKTYGVYHVYSKILEGDVLADEEEKYYMGAKSHWVGNSDFQGFSVVKYFDKWEVSCAIDGGLYLVTISEDLEEVISKELILDKSCSVLLMCYSQKDNLYGIVYSLDANNESYILLTSNFIGFTLFSLGKIQPIWRHYKVSGSEYYLDTYFEIADYLTIEVI